MSSRTLLNLALFCLAGILALAVVFRPGMETEPSPQTLTALSGDGITRIQVTRTSREPLTFARHADTWVLEGGSNLPASDLQIRSLLALLQAPATRSYSADSLDLEAAGLKPPQAILMLNDTRFDIGLTDALDKLRYVKTGNTVFLVPDQYQHLINADWSSFVERRLLPAGTELTRLRLPELTLTRAADNRWQLFPAVTAVTTDDLQALVSNWEQATAYYVRRYQGTGSGETITLEATASAEPLIFHVIAQTPELILARPELGIQYHLQGDMQQSLLALPDNAQTTAPADTE